ncbi:MAG: hypothetical protein ABR881_15130 [Candidatus Sulfotelmatobacter sp.]
MVKIGPTDNLPAGAQECRGKKSDCEPVGTIALSGGTILKADSDPLACSPAFGRSKKLIFRRVDNTSLTTLKVPTRNLRDLFDSL